MKPNSSGVNTIPIRLDAVAAHTAPANPAELLIVSGDGARYRTNEADVLAETGKRRVPAANKSAEVEDRGWRENKVGVVIRAQKGHTAPDGTYHPPEELVKTYVATTGDIRFNPDGSSSGGRITLADGSRRVAVGVDWLTGRVTVADVH